MNGNTRYSVLIIPYFPLKKQEGADKFFYLILENTDDNCVDITAAADQYMTLRVEGLNPTSTIGNIFYAEMDGSYLNNPFIEKTNAVVYFEMWRIRRSCGGMMLKSPSSIPYTILTII